MIILVLMSSISDEKIFFLKRHADFLVRKSVLSTKRNHVVFTESRTRSEELSSHVTSIFPLALLGSSVTNTRF